MTVARPFTGPRLLIKKSVDQIRQEAAASHLRRTLGAVNLVFLGVGCIIGAGIYVMTGSAAAHFAGPAVMLSFVIAGIVCVFAGLCYAELASTMPVAGSAYTYSYTTLGEVFAWIMGWLLVLEYGVAAATVAAGWSGNVTSFLGNFGVHLPAALTTSFIQAVPSTGGAMAFTAGHGLNLIAAFGIVGVASLLVLGVSESASVNNVIVVIKVGVLVVFVAFGISFVNVANWRPFIPPNEGGFTYGIPGIFRAASVIFFAYVGFEAVSTAAGEAKNPQKDMPIGILGSLLICTVLYMLVAAVLTGVVPFRQLGVPAPIALAVDRIGVPWISILIKIGAIAGLTSVMLILTYGQSRVFYAMARDGLLPGVFSRLHPRFRTPWIGTIILGLLIAVAATLLPIEILGDLVSLGTACAFAIVCVSVLWLRRTRPDLERPFRAPGGAMIPLLGIAGSLVMAAPLIIDLSHKATHGDPIPAMILVSYIILGAVIYLGYGLSHSRLAQGLDVREDDVHPTPEEAIAHGVGKDRI